jgi:hypothetical protein
VLDGVLFGNVSFAGVSGEMAMTLDPGGVADNDKRACAVRMCRALALEAENPDVSLSAVADMALAIAERLLEVETAGARPTRFTVIEGGRGDAASVDLATVAALSTVMIEVSA